jgi:hypothetical protein
MNFEEESAKVDKAQYHRLVLESEVWPNSTLQNRLVR